MYKHGLFILIVLIFPLLTGCIGTTFRNYRGIVEYPLLSVVNEF